MRNGFVKAFLSLAVVFAILLSISSPCLAGGPIRKLGRGVANTLTGPLELPRNIVSVTEEEGYAAGLTYGILKGIAWSVLRTTVGIYETITFPIPLPSNYDPILEPEFLLRGEY